MSRRSVGGTPWHAQGETPLCGPARDPGSASALTADPPEAHPVSPASLKPLRRTLRAARRALSRHERETHAGSLARILAREPAILRARRLGVYWPADGEIDPRPFALRALARGARLYLPVLRPYPEGRLWLVPWRPGEALVSNRFRIPEPRDRRRRVAPWALDLLLLPLVGFDADCNRLGMGGGFYDRTLGFLRRRRAWRRPRLVGLAHECQLVPHIAPRPWDIPLDAVATERRLYRRPRGLSQVDLLPPAV